MFKSARENVCNRVVKSIIANYLISKADEHVKVWAAS